MTKSIQWHDAPVKTTYGDGMLTADVELDKDSTLTIACHRDDVDKVPKVLAQFGTGEAIRDGLDHLEGLIENLVNDFQDKHGVVVEVVKWTTFETSTRGLQYSVDLRAVIEP